MMTPSQIILQAAEASLSVTDADGRDIQLRRLTALDKLRLFKALGPELSQNEPYLGMAILAYSVTAIDGVPVPAATTEAQIEGLVAKLGDAGLAAAVAILDADHEGAPTGVMANAGN
jgi:hypothetical protein